MQSKKQLLRAVLRESRPPKGFGQWILIFEARRLSDSLGLVRLEGYTDKKLEWSGGLSMNLPQPATVGPDGKEVTGSINWEKLEPGQSRFSVLTFEMRGKSLLEEAKGFFERSFKEGKFQDFLPWFKG